VLCDQTRLYPALIARDLRCDPCGDGSSIHHHIQHGTHGGWPAWLARSLSRSLCAVLCCDTYDGDRRIRDTRRATSAGRSAEWRSPSPRLQRHQAPATRPSSHQAPATRLQPLDSRHQAPQPPGSSHQAPTTRLQPPGSSHQAPATRFQTQVQPPDSSHQAPATRAPATRLDPHTHDSNRPTHDSTHPHTTRPTHGPGVLLRPLRFTQYKKERSFLRILLVS
jgi:hypothetical protein